MKKGLLSLLLATISIGAWAADGDLFTAQTVEGVEMTFKVISEADKTCQVGTGDWNNGQSNAVDATISGTITIPTSVNGYSVVAIGESAFNRCKNLEVVNIPESVTSIGEQGFYDCTSLISIDISANVTDIGYVAFAGCSNVQSIRVAEDNPVYDSRNDCNAIISTSNNEIIRGCQNTIIPEGITSLGVCSFNHCSNLSSIVFPSSLRSIGGWAFNGTDLTTIKIPQNVYYIGYQAFMNCYSLTSVNIPSNVSYIDDYAFSSCTSLERVCCYINEPFPVDEKTFQIYNQDIREYEASNATLYVPQGTKQQYESTMGWNQFQNIVEMVPYAVLSDNNTVLTFYYDENRDAYRESMSVESREWSSHASDIVSVVFDDSFANCATLTSTAYWFYGCYKLTSIIGFSNLKTDNVTDMSGMFRVCQSLTSLDVSGFNTDKVTNMSNMFDDCELLTSLDLSTFNTKNVTSMGEMFIECYALKSLNLSSFNTENVRDMTTMFANCESLMSLDLSSFNTTNTESMSNMFVNCPSLTTIYVGAGWSTANVINDNMFEGCTSLVGGQGTQFDENHIDVEYAHIDGGTANPGYFTRSGEEPEPNEPQPYAVLSDNNTVLTFYYDENRDAFRESLDVTPEFAASAWMQYREQIEKVVFDKSFANCNTITRTNSWFTECKSLTSIEGIEYLNTDNVIDMAAMFLGCHSLTSIDVSHFKTEKVTDMGWMFSACTSLTSLNISNFNTANVTSMASMFGGCTSLTSILVGSGWNTSKVVESEYMFLDCTSLVGGNGTRYDENHTDVAYARIDKQGQPGYLTGVDDSLVAYFPFNGNANDESGHGNNGEVIGNVELVTDRHGNPNGAYRFFGEPYNYISVPDKEILHLNKFTLSAWVYTDAEDYGSGYLINKGRDIEDGAYRLCVRSVGATNEYGGTNDAFMEENPPVGIWHMVTGTVEGDQAKIYLDGKLMGENTLTHPFEYNNTEPLTLGMHYYEDVPDMWAYPLLGVLDDVRIYNRVLSPSEIRALYDLESESQGAASFDGLTAWVSGGASLDEAFAEVGGREEAAKTIAAIAWGNTTPLTTDMLEGIDNPNLLIYVADASLAPEGLKNVVVADDEGNAVAEEIVLTDTKSGNGNFFCPEPFTAKKITYTREFYQQTEPGVSRGWESIALPFTVQKITHETNGEITPFGSTGSGSHFWLRGLSPHGLRAEATIQAYTPYVISMPNNAAYPTSKNLNGLVTFSATDATIAATPLLEEIECMAVASGDIVMVPNYQAISYDILYVLNVGQARGNYAEGSVFERGLREVRPFEAFTIHTGQGARPRYIPIETQGDATGIEMLNSESSIPNSEWYDLGGRKLQAQPKAKGVYIQKGRKQVVR